MKKRKRMSAQDKLWEAHDKEGLKLYGKKRWGQCNFGWGEDEGSIASKVYGRPCMVLTTTLCKDGSYEHQEGLYEPRYKD